MVRPLRGAANAAFFPRKMEAKFQGYFWRTVQSRVSALDSTNSSRLSAEKQKINMCCQIAKANV